MSPASSVRPRVFTTALLIFPSLVLKLGKRMELGSIRNIPLLPNFGGKLAQFPLDRKRD